MINDLTDCVEDTNGSTAYKLCSDSSIEVWIGDNRGTYFVRFCDTNNFNSFAVGINRIINVINKGDIDGKSI